MFKQFPLSFPQHKSLIIGENVQSKSKQKENRLCFYKVGFLFNSYRSVSKKELKSLEHSFSRIPERMTGKWLKGIANKSATEPAHPAFSSFAPYTTRPKRELMMAPLHIGQGYKVTYSSQPLRRQLFSVWQA